MKKLLSIFLAATTLVGLCSCKGRQDPPSVDKNGVITQTLSVERLDTAVEGELVRQRETADNTRMVINSDNPLFLFRPAMPYYSPDTYLDTYRALPEDIKAFSAVCADKGMNAPINELLETYEALLTKADKENIPVFLMTEVWDSVNTRQGFTKEQLCDLLERHPSLMGFVHVELSCNPINQAQIDRMKTTIEACREHGAVFIWQDMEYKWEAHTNVVNRALEDEELYELMKDYSHNIVIQDKHNGRGRHFSVQSSAMGAWLSDVCGNWGSNVEAWLWWEIAPNDYQESSIAFEKDRDYFRYPSALAGIDLFCDAVGGATVFSTEELNMFYTSWGGKVEFSEVFWSVVYPFFQRVVNGAVPDKEQVKEQVKVAYQFTSPDDLHMQDIESDLFIDTYGMTRQWFMLWQNGENSKKWLPYTGRYYILPMLPKYADAAEVLPEADVLNTQNYQQNFGSSGKKQTYLNARYPEAYTGDATLYRINGLVYIFNNNEFAPQSQTASLTLETSGIGLSATLAPHGYIILEESADSVEIELVNLRLDTYAVSVGAETDAQFRSSLLKGGKMDNEKDRRTTTLTFTGLERQPTVKLSGNNDPAAELVFDPNTNTATLTVVSNGKVTVEIVK